MLTFPQARQYARMMRIRILMLLALWAFAAMPTRAGGLAGWTLHTAASSSSRAGEIHRSFDEWRPAFGAGAGVRIQLGSLVSLQPELWWLSKGAKTGPLIFTVGGSSFAAPAVEWQVDYLELPVLARFDVAGAQFARPYVLLGPGFGFKTGGRVRYKGGERFIQPGPELDFARIFENLSTRDATDSFRDFDLDATVGLGVALGRGRGLATFEVRWLEGLLDPIPSGFGPGARNRAFVAAFGYERR